MATSTRYAQPAEEHDDEGELLYPPLSAATYQRPESRPREEEVKAQPKQIEHPIPSMQQAFSESYLEATLEGALEKPKLRTKDAKGRREELLDQDKSDGAPNAMWRFRPGQTCHELRKLMAQVSFGVYLLLNGLANSNAQVVSILQGHIDEIDEFLEMTMEDIELASKDIMERIDYLKLPMDNMTVFSTMLEDRAFRLQIVEGNAKIEHILSRTTTALVQSAQDLSEGLKSSREFAEYLESQEGGPWQLGQSADVVDIFNAMRGNTEGWLKTFVDLQSKTSELNALIVKLENMVSLIERTAGKVSRRTRFSVQPFTAPDPSRPISPDSIDNTTPQASPPRSRVAAAAPRLTLRFSRMPEERPSGPTYFDLPVRTSLFGAATAPPAPEIPARASRGQMLKPAPHGPDRSSYQSDSESDFDLDEMAAQFGNSRASRCGSARPRPDSEIQPNIVGDGRDDRSESPPPVLLLQPRTYTPVPPAPIPSPRVTEERKSGYTSADKSATKRLSVTKSLGDLRASSSGVRSPPAAIRAEPRLIQISPPRTAVETSRSPRIPPPSLEREEEGGGSPRKAQPNKRTSLRDRVSLKTTPPESIHVPPHNAPELQQPVFASAHEFQNYQTFVAPSLNHGADRASGRLEGRPSNPTIITDFSPPVFPGVIPSPHSDQQYFRPVQASPHSPLQQRPHTAGGLNPQYLHHQRNVPSAMGMSMLSSVSTLNQDSASSRRLKKKRSAFGWLKKAFSLDEEERLAYEAKKAQQTPNPYYDARSPKFLDGKRIR
ncbi:uncharacterized protein PpBr36_05699 [Pyricularia pennisetigena]|uniref:uncharacterized protein n=1 Tax=Pyricularia pennisetigena TaxID=1578925 RepID=UPI0011532D38|nr:uncharacterized protein PpBr36_05699 [Pyricularia pennisetigena]TLS23122.1 hypothetical protein PpBr36_05699 [Pyricularia pennisetigena]